MLIMNQTIRQTNMFRQLFEESLSVFQLAKTLFLPVSCLPSNMWQEFKKLGSACCTVRRWEFIWGYDSGFGSAANFWHCSPLQPHPCRSNVCNTAIDETPILTTIFKVTQRGRDFPRSTFTSQWKFIQICWWRVWTQCTWCTLSEMVSFTRKNSSRGVDYKTLSNT